MLKVSEDNDPEALRALIRKHQGALLNFFLRSGAYSFAEDLVQDTFIRLYRYRDRCRPRARFTTFLHTLARHVWIDHLRKRGRMVTLHARWSVLQPETDEVSAGIPASHLDAHEALQRLPEPLREVVVLSILQGLSYPEVAVVLEIPVGTVKSRMFYALQKLRELLDGAS